MDGPQSARGGSGGSRWSRLPAWAQGLLILVAMIVAAVVITGVGESLPPGWAFAWGVGVFGALIGLVVLLRHQVGNQVGGRDQFALFRRALRTGEVPPDADREQWRVLIEKQRKDRAGARWFYGLFALLIAGVNVHSAVTSNVSVSAKAAILVVSVVIAVGGWVGLPALIVRRKNRQLDALGDQLEDPSST